MNADNAPDLMKQDLAISEFTLGESELKDIAATVLKLAAERGASQAEVSVSLGSGLELGVRLGDVETLERTRDRGLGVTVYFGKRKGTASSTDLSPDAIRETVEAACTIARYTAEDRHAGLADAELMATDFPDLDVWHPWALDIETAIDIALRCEAAARDVDPRIENSDGASLSSQAGMRVYANSHGFMGAHRGTSHSLSCAVLAKAGDEMQRDYWYDSVRNAADMADAEAVGRRAGERTVARLGSRRLPTGKLPVMYSPEVARSLVGHYLGAMRGTSQYRESSFLLGAAGQQVFPEFMNIDERPRMPNAASSASFDSEGVATRDKALVENGVLQTYLLGSYSARRLGLQTTGNAGGVRNVRVHPGSMDFAALCKDMDKGLLVTELMGQGVNGVTGDYSRGASGFLVENGEIVHPVEEITIAGNLLDMYRNIRAAGSDIDTRGNIQVGSLLIDGMTIAGE